MLQALAGKLRGREGGRPAGPREMIVVVVLTGLFIGVGVSSVVRAAYLNKERSDFGVYHAAGRAVLEGTPLYEAANSRGWYYMYLPPFALLMVPLALLPLPAAAGAFYLVSLAMLLHSVRVSVRLAEARAGPGRAGQFWTGVITLCLIGWPWMSGLTRGQASVMLSWLTIVSVDWLLRQRTGARWGARWAGAFALVLAASIRVFPALLGLWLLMRRQWRAAGACLVAGIILVLVLPAPVFGVRGNVDLLEEWATTIALPTGDATATKNARYRQMMDPRIDKNQSLQATLIRWLANDDIAGPREQAVRQAAIGASAAMLVLTLVACAIASRRRGRDDPETPLLQAAALVVLMVLLPPVSWTHNYTVMALPLALGISLATRGRPSTPARVMLALWLLMAIFAFFPALDAANDKGGEWLGAFFVGGLCVWVWLMVELVHKPAQAVASASSTTLSGANMRSC